jgi:hypothetical protein
LISQTKLRDRGRFPIFAIACLPAAKPQKGTFFAEAHLADIVSETGPFRALSPARTTTRASSPPLGDEKTSAPQ